MGLETNVIQVFRPALRVTSHPRFRAASGRSLVRARLTGFCPVFAQAQFDKATTIQSSVLLAGLNFGEPHSSLRKHNTIPRYQATRGQQYVQRTATVT